MTGYDYSEKEIQDRKKIIEEARERDLTRLQKLSDHELNQRINSKRCGDCDNWNKSSLCPKEHNVNGISRGPASSAFPCEKFTPDFYYGIALEVQTMRKLCQNT